MKNQDIINIIGSDCVSAKGIACRIGIDPDSGLFQDIIQRRCFAMERSGILQSHDLREMPCGAVFFELKPEEKNERTTN